LAGVLFTIITTIFLCIGIYPQNKEKSITLSYNVLKTFTNEYSINTEYRINKHHSFGLTLGKVHDNPDHYVFILSTSQNNYPGLVYKGFVTRATYFYYLNSKDFYGFYIGPQLLFKSLYYNDITFEDSWGDPGSNIYVRNEKAHLYGLDFVLGWNFYIGPAIFPVSIYLNINCGFGLRYRHRNINTTSSITKDLPEYVVPLGNEIKDQEYVCSFTGLKIGFRIK
jgi:hypothetical protein